MKLLISLSCCLILLPIVCAEEINNVESHCKAGESPVYEDIRTNGTQCTGFYKIITAEECKLAAEYNSFNNIDKNKGYGGERSWSYYPFGCFYNRDGFYYLNTFSMSTITCTKLYKCICKPQTCIKCPLHHYSEGGKSALCIKCPSDRPYTVLNSKRDSVDSCSKCPTNHHIDDGGTCITTTDVTATVLSQSGCKAGEGVIGSGDVFASGSASQCNGLNKIKTAEECKLAAEYNSLNNIDAKYNMMTRGDGDTIMTHLSNINNKYDNVILNNIGNNGGYGGQTSYSGYPHGCIYDTRSDHKKYYFNDNIAPTTECSELYKCICKPKTCSKCPSKTYSEGGKCIQCPRDRPYTVLNSKQDSIDSCTDELVCNSGEGYSMLDSSTPGLMVCS